MKEEYSGIARTDWQILVIFAVIARRNDPGIHQDKLRNPETMQLKLNDRV